MILAGVSAASLAGQDVEMLGRHYGTRPPPAYYELIARDPMAFRLAHGRAFRMRLRMQVLAREVTGGTARAMISIGPREGPVKGTIHVPVVLGMFSDFPADSTGPYSRDVIQAKYFGDTPGTITAYYNENSGGMVSVDGDVMNWVRADVTQAQATGGASGLVQGTVGPFILSLLQQLPDTIDWGQFDNDGPDGIPNSGDDDGYVDALAVIQPTYGAECTGNTDDSQHIWSHKWNLTDAAGHAYTTTTPAANGGFIKIDDYLIEPVLDCDGTSLNPIGTFTHEMGHAYFGLPDLYDTSSNNQGDGNWDLMATGSWGCNGSTPWSPCHMGAWSKSVLGWVAVTTLPDSTDVGTLTLPPVETNPTVYRINTEDGSGEYFLLENREAIGFDQYVPGTGMLVWEIDPTVVAANWPGNTVNANAHLGVWVREADGRADMTQSGSQDRGDSGDPFPYVSSDTANRVFHAESNPSSDSYGGTHTGVTIVDIQKAGRDVTFHASTRFTRVTVSTEGDSAGGGLLTVDGSPAASSPDTYTSAPFVPHELDAAAGVTLGEGVREPFISWTDDSTMPRTRSFVTPMTDTSLVARYGGEQVQLAMDLTGGVDGVTPATFNTQPTSPDLWFAPGATVTIQAQARTGFEFLDWTGALSGQPNPATIVMNGPRQAGADFQLTYALSSRTVALVAAQEQEIDLQVENGNDPVTWSLVSGQLPDGLALDSAGRLRGVPMATGSFALVVRAEDAIGLTASAPLTLQISDPVIPLDRLASVFLMVGTHPTPDQMRYLDVAGNDDGVYDLGDLRAWVLAHPGLPVTSTAQAARESPHVIRFEMSGDTLVNAAVGGGGKP